MQFQPEHSGLQQAIMTCPAAQLLQAMLQHGLHSTRRSKPAGSCSEQVTCHESYGLGLLLLKADVSVFADKAKHLSGCGRPCSTAACCFPQLYYSPFRTSPEILGRALRITKLLTMPAPFCPVSLCAQAELFTFE